MSQVIRLERDAGIATLTIDRPAKRGAMSFAILAEFLEAMGEAGGDDETHVVILTGTEGCFCAGTDLSDLSTIPGKERPLRGSAQQTDRWWPIVSCPKPVIAAIDGPAVGMGAEFTSQCDIRIGSTRARFAWNFAHRGLVPDTGGGTWLLPRILGHGKALELLYSGRFVDAEEALAMGYVSEVVAPGELAGRARAVAEQFLEGSPLSHRLMKELVYRGLERDQHDHMAAHTKALRTCFDSEDHAEGVASFLERRPASFRGR